MNAAIVGSRTQLGVLAAAACAMSLAPSPTYTDRDVPPMWGMGDCDGMRKRPRFVPGNPTSSKMKKRARKAQRLARRITRRHRK